VAEISDITPDHEPIALAKEMMCPHCEGRGYIVLMPDCSWGMERRLVCDACDAARLNGYVGP